MDYSCRDIPMRLNIKYQPLDFDIYFSQVTDIPNTSIAEQPYNFHVENEALALVDRFIESHKERTTEDIISEQVIEPEQCKQPTNTSADAINVPNIPLIPLPSCPIETPLTPIKSSITSQSIVDSKSDDRPDEENSKLNQINPKDFEDIHYNPFDQLELQTIDELRELDLVFQAVYQPSESTS